MSPEIVLTPLSPEIVLTPLSPDPFESRGQNGQVAKCQMAVNALVDAEKRSGRRRARTPPAGLGLGRLLHSVRPARLLDRENRLPRLSPRSRYDPGHCEPPADRRRNRSVPGCEVRSRAVRNSPADRKREG